VVTNTAWQEDFTNLVDLEIIIGVDEYLSRRKGESQHYYFDPETLDRLEIFLGRTKMGLKAKQVRMMFEINTIDGNCPAHNEILDELRVLATTKE
jgi:DNA-binding transcriptional MerR regulator